MPRSPTRQLPLSRAGAVDGARGLERPSIAPVSAVLARAEDMGLMAAGTQQVGARLPARLLDQAKKRTGIASTTNLLAYALASLAIEDDFAAAFVAARGRLDPDLDVGF